MSQFSVISTDSALSIELYPDRWRLIHLDSDKLGRVVFAVTLGEEPVTSAEFAERRKLPVDGLPLEAIEGVVLGWSPKLGAWQLGLAFTAAFAASRGSRWCELTRWNDPDGMQHEAAANRAARALSRIMRKPLKVIPPKVEAAEEAAPVAPPKPLPPLPLDLGIWQLERDSAGLALTLAGRWPRSIVLRILWYALWMVIFFGLSILSLTVDLALPNTGLLLQMPQFLPYAGLIVGGVLVLLIIKNLITLFTHHNRVVINSNTRTVTAMRGAKTQWTLTAHHLEGIYASEILVKRGKQALAQHGELNLRTDDRRFRNVIVVDEEHKVGKLLRPMQNTVDVITQNDVETPLMAAAVYVSQTLGDLPLWYDQRTG